MTENQQTGVIYGHYLLASGLLGGLFPSIFLFNLDYHSALTCIVGNVPSSTKFMGSIAIVGTILDICKNKNSWVCTSQISIVANVKIVVLWILGIVVCIARETGSDDHTNIVPELAKTLSIVFILLQTLFLTGCSRYGFYESRKIKYIMSILTVANIVNWLDTTVLSSIIMTESNLTQIAEHSNSLCINLMHERTQYFHGELYLLPFDMEYSILATTIVIGLPLKKYAKNNYIISLINQSEEELITTCRHLFLSRKQKSLVIVTCILLNIPFFAYIIDYPTSLVSMFNVNNIHVWLLSVIGAKIIIFILLTIAYFNLYKICSIKTQPIFPNFNDIALIVGSSAVNASGILNYLYQVESNHFDIIFHSWFNIFYILYQTIFILFLKCIVIRDKYSPLLIRVRMFVLILISYNIMYWLKDSLFFLSYLKDDVQNSFIRVLFFLLYPLMSFYRFQSAIGMMLFLF